MRVLMPSLKGYLGLSCTRVALLVQARAQFASFGGSEWVERDRELRQRAQRQVPATSHMAY